jgi:ADP-ribose pyrophosphatase YjhB (NUDIX family)
MNEAIEWNSFEKGVFLVNVLGIVLNKKTGKILIGKREKDPFVEKLSWVFPGGRPAYGKTLEESLKLEVKKKTGVNVKVMRDFFIRIPKERKEFLLIYYYCELTGGKLKAGEKFTEVKWVKPLEVKKYFTTSIAKETLEFLKKLH